MRDEDTMYVENISADPVVAPFLSGGRVEPGEVSPCNQPYIILSKDRLFLTMTGIAKYAYEYELEDVDYKNKVELNTGYALYGKLDTVYGLYIPVKTGQVVPDTEPTLTVVPKDAFKEYLKGLDGVTANPIP